MGTGTSLLMGPCKFGKDQRLQQQKATVYGVCDRWRIATNSSWKSIQLNKSDGHLKDTIGNSLKLACTTADTSIASSELFIFQQRIEGQNVQQLRHGTS